MNRYAIRRNNRNKIVGILNYDEKAKKYTIEIPENVTPKEAPFMMSLLLKKGNLRRSGLQRGDLRNVSRI